MSDIYCADFETTVYDNQTYTEVWAAAIVPLGSSEVMILHSITDFFRYLYKQNKGMMIYFHNLKFDGTFILNFLIRQVDMKAALVNDEWLPVKDMPDKSYRYTISAMGQWYEIIVKYNNHIIKFRDSLKILPFSVKTIGKAFQTEHQKIVMEYKGERFAGCEITEAEQEYIRNDVLVMSEALSKLYQINNVKMTIGASCLSEFRKPYNKYEWEKYFPDLTEYQLSKKEYGYKDIDSYIRSGYRGGWCYVKPDRANQIIKGGCTADVNSLYPSMMHSMSGNYYPFGEPVECTTNISLLGKYTDITKYFYFIRVRTRFKVRKNHLPFITISNNLMYPARECLTTSDIYDRSTGKYYSHYIDIDGNRHPATVTLTLSCIDYEMLKKHYILSDTEILSFVAFRSVKGIFDEYIDKYAEIKKTSKGAMRQLAKLMLNNIYGKFATSPDSSFKVAYLNDKNALSYRTVNKRDRPVVYIPIGAAITSYARQFTITAAQKNYKHFIYADTDSIHCDIMPDKIKGINIDDVNFCCWKIEATWDKGIFVRAKTYIEHISQSDGEPCEPYYNIKCAGMPETSKRIFSDGLTSGAYKLTDFKVGLELCGKLLPKQIEGGTVLQDTTFKMLEKKF
jgi:hypothetical protein